MTVWIASDLHLNHLNILKYCPHRWVDNDGFSPPTWGDVAKMNEKIISNWNSLVQPEDEVYILGDVCMGQIDKAPANIRLLNGKKYLVKGNHDKTLHKMIQNDPSLSDLFVWIRDVHEMYYGTGKNKIGLFMSHYPHASWNGMNKGAIHLHGHLHGSPSSVTGRIKDVGIDCSNLYPRKLDDLVEELLKIDIIRDHH